MRLHEPNLWGDKCASMSRKKGTASCPSCITVHTTWQIDGKEQVALSTGLEVSWGNIADEASSTALYSGVFPPQADDAGAGAGDVPSGQPLF